MFPMIGWGWDWDWGWGWAAAAGSFFFFVVFVVIWFFFLWNLQGLLQRVDPRNRAMPPGHVWLNFIPIFNLGWFIYTVIKIKESLSAEYAMRGWTPEGDQGYNVGIAAGVLAIASFFLGWIPVIGWAIGLAAVICWIIYWLKTHEIKNHLRTPVTWSHAAPGGYPPAGSGPYAPPGQHPYEQHPYDQQSGAWAGAAGAAGAGAAAGAAGAWAAGQEPAQTGYEPPPEPSAWTAAAAMEAEEEAATAAPASTAASARVWAAPPVAPSASSGGTVPTPPSAAASSGEAAEQALRCAACGSSYQAGDKFCRNCGLRLP